MNGTQPNCCPRCNTDLDAIPLVHGVCPVCARINERIPEIVKDVRAEIANEGVRIAIAEPANYEPSPELLNVRRGQLSDADRIRLHGMAIRWQ